MELLLVCARAALIFYFSTCALLLLYAFQIIGIQYNSAARLHQSMELY